MLDKVVFIDIETTGTNPNNDLILEVGCVRFDPYTGLETESGRFVVGFSEAELAGRMPHVVHNMHNVSGLLREVVEAGPSVDRQRRLGTWLMDWLPERSIMAGYSVHFDREFLLEHFPILRGWVHHRVIDVSTLRELAKEYRPGIVPKQGKPAHRAMEDCRAALSEFNVYRAELFGWAPSMGPET